jgi:anti-sigma regulatory factor (Ser/Thr protein kinase)
MTMTAARWSLGHNAASPKEARAAVRVFLAAAGLSHADRDAVELVTSELVANAILHTPHAAGAIELRLDERMGTIHIEVHDNDPRPPAIQEPITEAEGGRGLSIVDRMATEWGWEAIHGDGKLVWCDLPSRRGPVA